METRQRQRVERLRQQTCHNFNQGIEKDLCLKKRPAGDNEDDKCILKLKHWCSICTCPGHGSNRCRDHIRDDSTPNPDNVTIQYVNHGRLQNGVSVPSIFAPSPPPYTAQAAIKRDYRRQRGDSRKFTIEWDHSELLSARYNQYRQKQRSPKTRDKKEVWPDDLEESFQIGLRVYARRGRKKVELHAKLCGGNEFISNWIWLATGIWRDRKQISSHIQVLKGYMSNNPAWISLLRANPVWNKKLKKPGNSSQELTPEYEDSTAAHYSYLVEHNVACVRPLPPTNVLPSNAPHGPTIRSVKLTMVLRDKPPESTEDPTSPPPATMIHHMFTSIQSEMGSAPRALETVPHWRSIYPGLRPFDDAGSTAPIFLFESSLSLMEDYPGNTRIEIDFNIDFAKGAYYQGWHSRSQAYDEMGSSKVFEFNNLEELEPPDPEDPKPLPQPRVSKDQTLTLKIPFRAEFWRDLFWNFRNHQLEADATGEPERIRQEHGYPRRYLSKLTIMQELWATPLMSGAQPRRMAILLWKFQQTHANEVPTTSWRRLTPPAPPFHAQSPVPPQLQPSVNIVSKMQPECTAQLDIMQAYIAGHYQHYPHGIFAENPEQMLVEQRPIPSEKSSPESGAACIDIGSFPPSTSTSFPSSVSGSTFRTIPSQQSSFDSADGSYPCLEALVSQDSRYQMDMQEEGYQVHETTMEPQEGLLYDTHECLHVSQLNPHSFSPKITEYPSFETQYNTQPVEDVTLMGNHHDFTGGQIQLAYAQQEMNIEPEGNSTHQQEDYEVPLIAPRAHMISQHQILQLQHFEELQQGHLHYDHHDQHEQTKQEHLKESAGAEQLLGLEHGEIQQPSNYQELDQQWTLPPPPPWEQHQQQLYQNCPYAEPKQSIRGTDGWYEDAGDKSERYLADFQLSHATINGPEAGYPSPVTDGVNSRGGEIIGEKRSTDPEKARGVINMMEAEGVTVSAG